MSDALTPRSWAPPIFELSTAENDGTKDQRYDVRKTLAYVTEDLNNVNNVFMLYWITTTTGEKFHLTTNAGLRGSKMLGSFLSLNDLQTRTTRGASIIEGGSGNKDHLELRSATQTVIAPEDGDKWTGTQHTLEMQGVKLETTLRPTGQHFYYGGSGCIQLTTRGPDPDYSTTLPGWSWYWTNPTTRIAGTLAIDGTRYEIDPEQSYSIFERQWGNFHIGKGYYALWFWLSTGEVLISWNMEPSIDGVSEVKFASVWHPNGLHETIPVGPNSRASNVITSEKTGLKYFKDYFLDLPARNASFSFTKWFEQDELNPALPEQMGKYITIAESYGEGTGVWDGKEITVQGHVEQLSTLRD
ncbi:hypothetical protein C7974DRAFT_23337 [Boeremia exigua]|uniref:uncharacterized protein n=1 Tax=Boeremia exigua TaxID=749465 RepID=UPI001E8D6172|nr:uncharacterized protein C7974DRAFT_23337 [Boeremia exigua]KAH6644570.1 hypothetical protein C7974DRAFT_23337 [Boeremia exigua]